MLPLGYSHKCSPGEDGGRWHPHSHQGCTAVGLTFDVVCTIIEFQLKDIVGGTIAVQGPSHLSAANEAVFPTEDDDWPVNQLHHKVFRLTYPAERWGEGTEARRVVRYLAH